MAAQLMYVWYYVAPNTTASVFIHGFSDQEAVVFSATGAWETEEFGGGPLKVRQDEVYRHVDNTVARKVYVQNLDGLNPCAVRLSAILEENPPTERNLWPAP